MMSKATEPAAHSIDETLADIRAKDREIIAAIIDLEDKGITPADDLEPLVPATHTRALSLLNGFAPPALQFGDNQAINLRELLKEKKAIEIALEIGRRQHFMFHAAQLAAELRKRKDGWANLVLKRHLAVAALRRANADCEKFKQQLAFAHGGISPSLPCDGFELLGAQDIVA